jgi:hypothetical protein
MSPQQRADVALRRWQELRALDPDLRIVVLVDEFFSPPIESDLEYQITLNLVSEEMSRAA